MPCLFFELSCYSDKNYKMRMVSVEMESSDSDEGGNPYDWTSDAESDEHDEKNDEEDKFNEDDVKKIIDVKYRSDGETEYRLKMKSGDKTWESAKNVDCPNLVEKFYIKKDAEKKKAVKAVEKKGKSY